MNGLLLMVSFFTRIPIGNRVAYSETRFIKALPFFPVTGLIIGLVMMGPYLFEIPTTHRTLIVIGTYLWLTGGLHLDGLGDTLDGLLSNKPKDKILEIMKDSRIGAFGAVGLIFYFLAMYNLLEVSNWSIVFFMPIIGKIMGMFAASQSDYARQDDGMGRLFIEHNKMSNAVLFIIGIGVFGTIAMGRSFLFYLGGTLIYTVLFTRWCTKKIDGMTGDTIGCVIESSQVLFLLIGGLL